ncbi:efflux RND transporter periplasmic adaptor subunit [Kordiimonas lipolytica]|uniref:Efflux RND transporter periplasmic adaptor subunit n=1 Tax=Kordiimonas lipolytica TaxID=1662421 RepID=A0ABV8UB71_9PROT|nr:efflux RND transporter periplasmic adaptor subunit [Kordiimonas lipolytica]
MLQHYTVAAVLSLALAVAPTVSAEGGQIALSQTQQARLGVQTGDVQAAERQALVVVPGRITPPLDARLAVAVPFAGIVQAIHVLEGANVKTGDSLLTVASNDFLEAQARLSRAQADYRALKSAAERLKTLSREGVVALGRAEAAEAEATRANAELAATRRMLDSAKPVAGQKGTYSLVAPHDATIAQLQVMPGEMIHTLDSAVVLEGTGALWVEAELPSRFLGKITLGDMVSLQPSGAGAKIIAIGRTVDPQSRSVTVRAELDRNDSLRPGQSVQVTVFGVAEEGAFSVPRDAVVRLAGGDAVFVAERGGYGVVPVTVLSRGAHQAIVTGPLSAGAKVAISALTELKALALEGD